MGKANTVLEAGYPRNDFLINHTPEDEAQIKRELGLPMDKKVILYAPTWRDNQHDAKLGYVYRTHMDFDALRREFGDDYVILFRAHYLVANSFDFKKYKGFVYDACGVTDINRLYVVADVLITDYSSVFLTMRICTGLCYFICTIWPVMQVKFVDFILIWIVCQARLWKRRRICIGRCTP